MIIKQVLSQYRRDFIAIMECEFCGHTKNVKGYDDANYHQNVIPNMKCTECAKSTITGGAEVKPRATKYPEGFQI